MTKDQKRIASIAKLMDGIGAGDFHELATERHAKRCGCFRGPAAEDYYRAVAHSIDEYFGVGKSGEQQ